MLADPRLASRQTEDDSLLHGDVPILMQGVVAVYDQLGWVVTSYQPQDSVVEKDYGIRWWIALALLPIPLVGLAILISNVFLRRHYRMHLTLIGQGDEIEIRGHGMRTVLNRDNVAVGGLPIPQTPHRWQVYAIGGLISGVCTLSVIAGLWLWLR